MERPLWREDGSVFYNVQCTIYFTVSGLRAGPCIYIPQEQGGPVIPPGTGCTHTHQSRSLWSHCRPHSLSSSQLLASEFDSLLIPWHGPHSKKTPLPLLLQKRVTTQLPSNQSRRGYIENTSWKFVTVCCVRVFRALLEMGLYVRTFLSFLVWNRTGDILRGFSKSIQTAEIVPRFAHHRFLPYPFQVLIFHSTFRRYIV
jgi:hypothetical protein